MKIDFAVIGGSYAGMAAALQLARARRQVLVVDAGRRRNQCVDDHDGEAHGFLTQDGRAPGAIAEEARRQLRRYPTVHWMAGQAEDGRVAPDGRLEFRVGDVAISAGRLILATGVRDELPPVLVLPNAGDAAPSIARTATATSWTRAGSASSPPPRWPSITR